jgi:hypothetical protein
LSNNAGAFSRKLRVLQSFSLANKNGVNSPFAVIALELSSEEFYSGLQIGSEGREPGSCGVEVKRSL